MQTAVYDLHKATSQPFMTYWQGEWSAADLSTVQVQSGDPAGQARLEAFTLLVSIFLWRQIFSEAQGRLAIVGDALGMLHDALKLRAKDPVLNSIMCELALVLAPAGQCIQGAHIWSERNSTCDEPSRMTEGALPSQSLALTRRTRRRTMNYEPMGKSSLYSRSRRDHRPTAVTNPISRSCFTVFCFLFIAFTVANERGATTEDVEARGSAS